MIGRFIRKNSQRGEIASIIALIGLGIVTVGIIAGRALVREGPRQLPQAATGESCVLDLKPEGTIYTTVGAKTKLTATVTNLSTVANIAYVEIKSSSVGGVTIDPVDSTSQQIDVRTIRDFTAPYEAYANSVAASSTSLNGSAYANGVRLCQDAEALVVSTNSPTPTPTLGVACAVPRMTGSAYCSGNQAVMTWSWNAVSGVTKYQFQRDDNTDFSSLAETITVNAPTTSVQRTLPAGIWWRARISVLEANQCSVPTTPQWSNVIGVGPCDGPTLTPTPTGGGGNITSPPSSCTYCNSDAKCPTGYYCTSEKYCRASCLNQIPKCYMPEPSCPTITPTRTPTPTITSCIRGPRGNLDCSLDGCIDTADFELFRQAFGKSVNGITVPPGQYTPDLIQDAGNLIDTADYEILRSNFGSCSQGI